MLLQLSLFNFVFLALFLLTGCNLDLSYLNRIESTTPPPPQERPLILYGQSSFKRNGWNSVDFLTVNNGLYNPSAMACGGGYCYVSDSSGNRVLIYSGFPIAGQIPIGVLGQADFVSYKANRGQSSPSRNSLRWPSDVYINGTKLFIVDADNNRVLIYNNLPTSNSDLPDIVLGQSNFTSGDSNRGGTPNADTLSTQWYLSSAIVDSGKLLISDGNNSRILIWNSIPTANGTPADVVIGQPDFVTNTANTGGRNYNSFSYPSGMAIDNSGRLYVADWGNCRVIVFASVPTSNYQSATRVIGQANATSASCTATQNRFNYVNGVAVDGSKIYITDAGNSRLMGYNSFPVSDGANADFVLGQTNFTNRNACVNGLATANCFGTWMFLVDIVNGKLVVPDPMSNRILVYNTPPSSNVSADDVIGQSNFLSNGPFGNLSPIHKWGVSWSGYSKSFDNKVAISDRDNHRVLIFENGRPDLGALYVLGQTTSYYGSVNQGATTSATSLSYNKNLAYLGNQLFVSDTGNNRILVYNTQNLSTGMAASFVIGQPNFTSSTGNNGGRSSRTLLNPADVHIHNSKLYISDTGNCRVLVYQLPIAGNFLYADSVIGQVDGTSATCTYSNTSSGHFLAFYIDDEVMIFAGGGARRVLFTPPVTSGLFSAQAVFGQANYTSTSARTIGQNSMSTGETKIVRVDNYFFVTDKDNGRVLVFDGIPNGTDILANHVIGQKDFVSSDWENIGNEEDTAFNVMSGPTGLDFDGDYLYVSEAWNSRVIQIPYERITSFFKP